MNFDSYGRYTHTVFITAGGAFVGGSLSSVLGLPEAAMWVVAAAGAIVGFLVARAETKR